MSNDENRIRVKPVERKPGERAPRPKAASSLIIYRKGSGGLEVLMGRRERRTRFMPDAYVFPGGRVDPADSRAKPATHLLPEVEMHLLRTCTPARARGLAMSAVRETFEETGLLLGVAGTVGGTSDKGWQAVAETGLAPDLARLDYIARAVTRATSPIRFDARFFMAEAAHFTGEIGGSGELLDLGFVAIDDARELPTAMITQFIISEVARLETATPEQRTKRVDYKWRGNSRVVDYV